MKKSFKKFPYKLGFIIVFFSVISACAVSQKKDKKLGKEELLFQTGFEGTTRVAQDTTKIDYGAVREYLTGRDNTLNMKSDFGTEFKNIANGFMVVNCTGGDSAKRFAKIIEDPTKPNNKVLQFWLNDSWAASENQQKARVQTDIFGIKGGFKEFYQSVRVYLTEDFRVLRNYPEKFNWLTISEFWNNEWWEPTEKYGFRIGLTVTKPVKEESDLYFRLNSEDAGQKEVWTEVNKQVKVPIGKWFTLEYYFKEGNDKTGRFYVAVTPEGEKRQEVFDVKNFTHNTSDPNPNGLTGYNPMKLYTSKEVVAFVKSHHKTLQIYWDDFKLWKNKRP